MENLKQQIKQNEAILNSQCEDNEDMQEKISTQRETITRRDNEIIDLRDRINYSSNQAEELRKLLDRLAMQKKILAEEKQLDEAEIEQMKQIRIMRKQEEEEQAERLRKTKNEHFNQEERLKQIQRARDSKQKELENIDQELLRVQNKLLQNKDSANQHYKEKHELDNKLKVQLQQHATLYS